MKDLDQAITQARDLIHASDVDGLKKLIDDYPVALSWRDGGGLLGFATCAYGDAGTPEREQWFTRAAAAELLIDAGAFVASEVVDGLLRSRAKGLLQLFHRKGLLPATLKFSSALGDEDAIRAALDRNDRIAVREAFFIACHFSHPEIAALLLDRCIALDAELGARVDHGVGRSEFVRQFVEDLPFDLREATIAGPWRTHVMSRVKRALRDGDLAAFNAAFEQDRWMLDEDWIWFQVQIIETACFNFDRELFIRALFDLKPALLKRQPPSSDAVAHAIAYGNTQLLPLLARVWPLPDDLPHAAGTGDLARVMKWFDSLGSPTLGNARQHYPATSPHLQKHDDLQWGPPRVQHVLDVALAWSVINRHFEIADFLLDHGANINTDWNSHEPASILHHLVFLPNSRQSMQYLIDRGIDLSIKDYRWNSTAAGWARYALQDDTLAEWLEAAAHGQ